MKQRGIQPGTTAFDESSKTLDISAKIVRDRLSMEFPTFKMFKSLPKEMKLALVGDDCFGFAPDGGAWFDQKGKLIACFECKKQGTQGNAYERWWDNACTAKHLNEKVVYVTFCIGEGANAGCCLDKLRRKAGIMLGTNFEFVMSPEGLSEESIEQKMREVLERFIE
jgi:hypothetical protein